MSDPTRPVAEPWMRPGDSWQCTAGELSSCGGTGIHQADSDGCVPVPSLRLRRAALVLTITSLATGLLIALASGPARHEFLAPGPLTHAHAQLLAGNEASCSACHGAGDRTLTDWMRDAVSSGKHIPVSQSQLCMDCHGQSLMREFALLPHNVDPSRLQAMTAAVAHPGKPTALQPPLNERGELACASCHREHHGRDYNLAALTDQQCQICHADHFHSFETDHPEFRGWPLVRSSNVHFDHNTHALKHFPDQHQAFDCRSCHVDDDRGNVKLVASFDVSCAQCHAGPVYGEESTPWTFFQLPMLNLAAMNAAGHDPGEWPAECSGDFDGEIPAPMRVMLAADPEIREILLKRGPRFQWSDLDAENPEDLADAHSLVWGVKRLLLGLSVSTREEIRGRVVRALSPPGSEGTIGRLPQLDSGLYPGIFADARQRWLPDLQNELTGLAPRIPAIARKDSTRKGAKQHLVVPDRVFGRPMQQDPPLDQELLAENPLVELLNNQPQPSVPSPESLPPDIRHARPADANGVVDNPYSAAPPQELAPNQELLAENPLARDATGSDVRVPPQAPALPQADQAVAKLPDPAPGGWYRNDRTFAISWKVVEHADPVIKGWAELALTSRDDAVIQLSNLRELIENPAAPGACAQCHAPGDDLHWSPQYRETRVREFTRFSHAPHDIQSSLNDCASCHVLNRHPAITSGDGAIVSDFAPLSRAQCATCHQRGGAPSGCVDCHNYHVGSRIVD